MEISRIITFICVLFSTGNIAAQQLTPFVFSSSGGFYNTPSGMLSFTSGEMAAVETYTAPAGILTQGFQQTWDLGTSINAVPNLNFSFRIYPNPSDGQFKLVTETEPNEHIVVKVIDILGRQRLQSAFNQEDKINMHSFDLSNAGQGIYLIVVSVKENGALKPEYHFLRKIQIAR